MVYLSISITPYTTQPCLWNRLDYPVYINRDMRLVHLALFKVFAVVAPQKDVFIAINTQLELDTSIFHLPFNRIIPSMLIIPG